MSPEGPAAGVDQPAMPAESERRPGGRGPGTFIGRHWRGNLELEPGYRLCGIEGFALFAGRFAAIDWWANASIIRAPRLSCLVIATTIFLTLPLATWQVVGIWRSANRRARERHATGKRALWATMARLSLVLSVLYLGFDTAAYGGPGAIAYLKFAFRGNSIPRHVIRLLDGGHVLSLSGGFDFGTAHAVRVVLAASPDVRTVELDSVGGRVVEAEQVRRLIASRHLATYTSSDCLSACTAAYIGGYPRYLARNAKLGFHEASLPGLPPAALAAINKRSEQTLIRAGVSPAFAHKALTTPASSLWTPDIATLLAAHVVTQVVSGYGPAVAALDVADVMHILDGRPDVAALEKYDPATYARMEQSVTAAIRAGAPMATIFAPAHAALVDAAARYQVVAGDAVQVEVAKLLVVEATALAPAHADICLGLFFRSHASEDYAQFLPRDLQQRDEAVAADIIADGASAPSYATDSRLQIYAKARAISRQVRSDGFDLPPPPFKPAALADKHNLCLAMADFFRRVAALPQDQVGPLMRGAREAQ